MSEVIIPWGIETVRRIYHPDVYAGLPDGRYVHAVCEPYPTNFIERLRAAWWVLTGRAHAFIYPEAGDIEAALLGGGRPERTPSPLPFKPRQSGT